MVQAKCDDPKAGIYYVDLRLGKRAKRTKAF